jgi:hypothetical protein
VPAEIVPDARASHAPPPDQHLGIIKIGVDNRSGDFVATGNPNPGARA